MGTENIADYPKENTTKSLYGVWCLLRALLTTLGGFALNLAFFVALMCALYLVLTGYRWWCKIAVALKLLTSALCGLALVAVLLCWMLSFALRKSPETARTARA